MHTGAPHDTETDRLRRTTRDLVALSTLPAVWTRLDPAGVIDSLASVLLSTLDLDVAYIRCTGGAGAAPLEAIRTRQDGAAERYLPALRTMPDAAHEPRTVADPLDQQPLRVYSLDFGVGRDLGLVVTGSRRCDFPLEHERVLAGVGANHASLMLQRKLAEQALELSEGRFLDLADAAPAMLWVTEADGSCSFLSRAWYEFTGQHRDEGLGSGWIRAIHPDDRAAAERAFLAANEEKREFSLEHRILHKDGSCRWVIDMGRPRFSGDGVFLGYAGNVLDITDRKHTEQALHETQSMLEAVFDVLPVGVGVVDQAGAVRLSNRQMRQYLPTDVMPSRDEARRDRWRAFHADGRAYVSDEFPGARALRGERVVPGIEMLFTRDDGGEIWTQIASVPLLGSDGATNGQVTVVMDIDDFKRTEAARRTLFDEVERAHRNLSEFLAVLAHELRNPLAPIVTGLELMRMRADNSATVTHARGVIERQVRQLSHLIDDLLDIARVTNGKVELKTMPVDLKDIVANAVETSAPLMAQRKHAFSLALPQEALPMRADPARIAQVLGNLLTNAAKYTPPGGSVRLCAERDGADALVTVADSGVGIPAEALESVFDMFSQVGRNMSHAQGGLGIGLSLVRQLVALHGGSVSAASAGAGAGSTFVVRLPLDDAADAGNAGQAAAPQPLAGAALRILVTDDNADAASTLASLLELFGHDVRVAHDGPEALRIAAQLRPQVVFLDIGLPGMSGYDVARRLRELAIPRCTIVAVSGWGAPDDLARARDAGFDRHFTKPVAASSVSDLLRSLA